MGKFYESIDQGLIEKRDTFLKEIESDMHYTLNRKSDTLSFDWLDEIEKSCPFIDNIVRHPKVTLVKDERVVEVERAKKITVDSIKDLAKHSDYITDVVDDDVKISKILDVRNEETYNIYENRFLNTLIKDLDSFIYDKEKELEDFDLADDKVLEYSSTTMSDDEKIDIELRVSATKQNNGDPGNLKSLVEKEKHRITRVKEYITSWLRSDMIKELDRIHVPLINPPVKPTNVILKNPNFQVAVKLWEYIRNYGRTDGLIKKELESDGNKALLGYLDDAFLTSYFVLDSISKRKREEKEKILKYAILLLSEEVYRTITLLQTNGVDITEEELLTALAKLVQKESSNRLVGVEDIKKKFQSEIDEYLERAKKNL